ncbi:MAG: DUF2157 domain-containing protein [Chitinophagaceae bacterium]|nr:DUF2157 domain-containing protein [Chitinophagaceae bacterium]
MNVFLFKKIHQDGLVDATTLENIEAHEKNTPVSVYWDLLTLLYAGIFLLTTGVGIIIYKNIDSIGQTTITLTLAVACVACFYYSLQKAPGFSRQQVQSPNVLFDYIVLSGCLLLLILLGYLQFQYGLFGNRWGMATFIPMVLLFAAAYYFDHIGILSMAITNLAACIGISITPLRLLQNNDFNSHSLIYSGVALGVLLIVAGILSVHQNFKKHFGFTYKNFGYHLFFVSSIAALVVFNSIYLVLFLFLCGAGFYLYTQALKDKSFYLLVMTTLYMYAAITYVVIKNLVSFDRQGDAGIYLILMYLIGSAIGLVLFIMKNNKKIKNAGI